MRNRIGRQGNRPKSGFGIVTTLADRVRYLGTLTQAKSDSPVTVSSDYKRAETEPTTTLDHFCGAIDEDDLFGEIVPLGITIIVRTPTASGPIASLKPSATIGCPPL